MENGLSEREIEILRLVATGASNKEIATRLVISPNTVKVHLRNIFAKIEVVSRTEATLYALHAGLIPGAIGLREVSSAETSTVEPLNDTQIKPRKNNLRLLIAAAALVIVVVTAFFIIRPLVLPAESSAALNPVLPSRWQNFKPMPAGGSGMAAVSYEGRIYLIGGTENGEISGALSAYDAATDSWTGLAAKPTPVTAFGAVRLGEKIFVPGGQGADHKPTAILEVYDPRSDRWAAAAPMPKALSRFALAALEGNLYVFGGWDGAEFSAKIYQYDAAVDQWHEGGPLPTPLADAAAAALGTKIILTGGQNASGLLGETRAYYPQRELAGESAWEKRADLPSPRTGFSLAELAGNLYLAGGQGGGEADAKTLLIYEETSDRWTTSEAAPSPFGSLTGMAALGNFVHIFGGEADSQPGSNHLAYQAIYTVLIPVITH